ncbi:hypothetical protein CN189_15655 [Sinorhizobium meliloti]|nr:hypothetical protein CN189_15655 [Sinorhizobium meliloti]
MLERSRGVKINMVPTECEFEVDIRTPPGVPHLQVMERLRASGLARRLHDYPLGRRPVAHSCVRTTEMVGQGRKQDGRWQLQARSISTAVSASPSRSG